MWPLYCYKKNTTKQKFTRKCRQIIHNCYCRNFTLSLIWFLFIIILLFKEFIDECYSYFACNVVKLFLKVLPVKKKLNRIYISGSTKLLLIVYHCPMAITFFEVIMNILKTLSFTYTDCDCWMENNSTFSFKFLSIWPSAYLWFVMVLCLDPLRYIKKGIL